MSYDTNGVEAPRGGLTDDWGRGVKIFYFVEPRPEASIDDFESAWHALATPELAGLRRYVQTFPLRTPEARKAQETGAWCFGREHLRGTAELWFDDLEAFSTVEQQFRDALDQGLGALVDLEASAWIATRERPVLLGSQVGQQTPMIKATFHPIRTPGMGLAEYQHYWRTKHAEIAGAIPGTPLMARYIQCHVLPETYSDRDPESSDSAKSYAHAAEYDGIAELWWRTIEEAQESIESDSFQRGHLVDADIFIDHKEQPNFGYLAIEDRRIWP